MTNEEVWRYIPGTLYYEASNLGQVRRIGTEYPMAQSFHNGRKRIKLSISTRPRYFYVHRLVAACFLKGYKNDSGVIHIDGDYTNNALTNLRLEGRIRTLLPRDLGIQVIETGGVYATVSAAARAVDGQTANVSRVLSGTLNHHKGFTFKYVKI